VQAHIRTSAQYVSVLLQASDALQRTSKKQRVPGFLVA
jgi:hypothetical protein